MITLICGKKKWEVTIERAESVLRNPLNKLTGWELPSNYELKDGRIRRTEKTDRGQATPKGDKHGNTPRVKAEIPHGDSSSKE